MTIKAILRNGCIQPLEPIPPGWTDGQELVVEEPHAAETKTQVNEWAKDLADATAQVPVEEHDRFRQALRDIEREGKAIVRRERGLP